MKKNRSSLVLTLGAAALLLGGGLVAYSFLGFRTVKNVPLGTNVIPQNTLVAVSISTNPEQWRQLELLGTPESQVVWRQTIQRWQDQWLTKQGYDYQRDIQPWIGEEAVIAFVPNPALLPETERTPEIPPIETTDQSVILVLPIADSLKAKELLGQPKFLEQAKQRNYKGIEVQDLLGTDNQRYSLAVLGGKFVVIANHPRVLDWVIETYRGEPSLAKTPGYAEALAEIKSTAVPAQFYVNIPVAAAVTAAGSSRPIQTESLENLQQSQGIAATVSVVPDGLKIKGISWLKPNSQNTWIVENTARTMGERLPDNTLMLISGGNLQRLWQDYVRGAEANPIAPFNPQQMRAEVKTSTDLDLETDFLSWMAGEFALSLVPMPVAEKPNSRFAASFVFMVKATDRRAAEDVLTKLDERMKQNNFRVTEEKINNQSVVKWVSPYQGYTVLRGWLDGNVVFVSLGAPVVDQFLPKPKTPLVVSETFKQTMPSDLNPNNGQFFLDVNRSFQSSSFSLPEFPPSQKVWIDAIDSIGITTAIRTERTTRYEAFVRLKKIGE